MLVCYCEGEVEWDKVNRMGRWYKPWFYLYVATFLERTDKGEQWKMSF